MDISMITIKSRQKNDGSNVKKNYSYGDINTIEYIYMYIYNERNVLAE